MTKELAGQKLPSGKASIYTTGSEAALVTWGSKVQKNDQIWRIVHPYASVKSHFRARLKEMLWCQTWQHAHMQGSAVIWQQSNEAEQVTSQNQEIFCLTNFRIRIWGDSQSQFSHLHESLLIVPAALKSKYKVITSAMWWSRYQFVCKRFVNHAHNSHQKTCSLKSKKHLSLQVYHNKYTKIMTGSWTIPITYSKAYLPTTQMNLPA